MKTDVINESFKPSSIYLDRDVSIEDFILKLNDLSLVDIDRDIKNLCDKTLDQKEDIVRTINLWC